MFRKKCLTVESLVVKQDLWIDGSGSPAMMHWQKVPHSHVCVLILLGRMPSELPRLPLRWMEQSCGNVHVHCRL